MDDYGKNIAAWETGMVGAMCQPYRPLADIRGSVHWEWMDTGEPISEPLPYAPMAHEEV